MSKKFQYVFSRYEKKYLLNSYQHHELCREIEKHMHLGVYGKSTVCNLYYDTPDFLLIRRSILGGVYKEKLRLRCYGVPDEDTNAFIELKKKYKGIVYKRRMSLSYGEADRYLNSFSAVCGNTQIASELNYFLSFYGELSPQMYISCDRTAYTGNEDEELRITFDKDILWRPDDLDLRKGSYGTPLLQEGQYLMEIKAPAAMPLWLTTALTELKIYPTSFSKYGTAYKQFINEMRKGA